VKHRAIIRILGHLFVLAGTYGAIIGLAATWEALTR